MVGVTDLNLRLLRPELTGHRIMYQCSDIHIRFQMMAFFSSYPVEVPMSLLAHIFYNPLEHEL